MKIFLTLGTILFLSISVFGQFEFGIKLGPNLNSVAYNDIIRGLDPGRSPVIGFHLGFYGKVELSKKLALLPEVLFIQKGFDLNNWPIRTTRLNYLEIPLLLSYHLSDYFSLEIGPASGFLLSTKTEPEFTDINVYDDDLEISGMGGIRFFTQGKISFSLHYSRGLTKIAEFVDSNTGADVKRIKWYNQNFRFSVNFRLK